MSIPEEILHNSRLLWLAEEAFIWAKGNQKKVDIKYIESKWGAGIAGIIADFLPRAVGFENPPKEWKVLGEIPLHAKELKAYVRKPVHKPVDRVFDVTKFFSGLKEILEIDEDFEFKKEDIEFGRRNVERILFVGSPTFEDGGFAVPTLLTIFQAGDNFLCPLLGYNWIELKTGNIVSVSLHGLFWPKISDLGTISSSMKIVSKYIVEKKFGAYAIPFVSSNNFAYLIISKEKIFLAVGETLEEKDEDFFLGSLIPTEILENVSSFMRKIDKICLGYRLYKTFMCLSSVIKPSILKIFAFHLRYEHIDDHRIWFMKIKEFNDFDTYARYARQGRKYGILTGEGYNWKPNFDGFWDLVDYNLVNIIACKLRIPRFLRYFKAIINKNEVSVKELAKLLNRTDVRIRQVMKVFESKNIVKKKSRGIYVVNNQLIEKVKMKIIKELKLAIENPEILEYGFILQWILENYHRSYIYQYGLSKEVPIFLKYIVIGLNLQEGEPVGFRFDVLPIDFVLKLKKDDEIRREKEIFVKSLFAWKIFELVDFHNVLRNEFAPSEFVGFLDLLIINESRARGMIYPGRIYW